MLNNIQEAKRIVFKFGTNILRDESGEMAYKRVESFIEDISELISMGKEVIIVTSGAVGIGAKKLDIDQTKYSLFEKQACASVGQPYVMRMWEKGFQKFDVSVAQILLTEEDFAVRKRYLSLRNTLFKLLEHNIVPIINQNDAVCPSELEHVCFSDNDKLSALVASKLDADLLVIVSDINGLYDKNPKEFEDAKLINRVDEITHDIEKLATGATLGGRGGMITKLQGAKVVTNSGAFALIINGKVDKIIKNTFDGTNDIYTIFAPTQTLSSKKRWIAYATNIKGSIKINSGAKTALFEKQTSLLPVGIISCIGDFLADDVISIYDEEDNEIARGISNYDVEDVKKIMGIRSDKIEQILGQKISDDVISKDNLVLL
ncbi:MAG: glutamate 5-kinase [Cyanobacteria bacterium SIG30]|nr:glutamate 5-kinase [Cyanobacteria bacterium SIG30]